MSFIVDKVQFDKINNLILTHDDVVRYVLEKFDLLKKNQTKKGIIDFHTKNKYLFMAHNQNLLHELGRIVANHKKLCLSDLVMEYEKNLSLLLITNPTTKTHINTIMHIFGYFSKYFTSSQKDLFFNLVEQYRKETITIGHVLSEIAPLIFVYDNTYLASQTYFLLYSENRLGKIFSIL